mmetsp:Transcript_2520/g.7491  ORF Transcript_2520/g.7491 Transcript_2520/m.7491 type:complete len:478 (-) Transcript_2520:225-1658(-)
MFLSLLPLKAAGREQLLLDLKEMDVPTDKLIGGKLMGMLDIPGLSGGQRKKLLLALSVQMAVARDAKAMVLDEPFAGIDADSMPRVLQVLKRVESQRDTKVFLVTHDHFQLIEDAFPGTPELKIDHRELRVASAGKHAQVGVLEEESSSDDHLNTAEAANVMAQSIHSASERRTKEEKPTKPPLLDWYVVKRHFYEGEQMLPTFTIIVFGVLSGVATGRYQGFGEGIVPLSSIFAFLKVFMLEYIHFGSILNYCYKRGQHLEDVGLMVTSKKDAIAETVVIATIQSVALAFLLNGLLIAIGPRFWWVNSNILFIDAFYALLTQVAYTLLPVVQPNPLITMGSIFPYVAVWGFFNGFLIPREYALKNSRWLTVFSPTYHYACAAAKASGGQLQLTGSGCKKIGIHLAFLSPLMLFALLCIFYVSVRDARHAKKDRIAGEVAPAAKDEEDRHMELSYTIRKKPARDDDEDKANPAEDNA